MKILCSIVALFFALTVSAQPGKNSQESITPIVPTTVNNNLLFTWNAGNNPDATFYVQGSTDGKNFKTIAIVWGTTAEMNNVCMFKEKKEKINKDFTSYRIYMEAATPVAQLK